MGLPYPGALLHQPGRPCCAQDRADVIALVGLFWPLRCGMLGRLYTPELLLTGRTDAVVLLLPQALVVWDGWTVADRLVAAGAMTAFLATATGLTVTVAGVLSRDIVGRKIDDPIVSFRVAAAAAVIVRCCSGCLRTPYRARSLGVRSGGGDILALVAAGDLVASAHPMWGSHRTAVGGVAATVAIVVSPQCCRT